MTQATAGFAHLHLHTEYSLLDGGNKIPALMAHVKSLGMDAVAITDHGNMHGAIEFYTAAKKAGVKPILGIEAYVAPGDRREKKATGMADGGFHLVLLAETLAGWRNLLKLSSDAYLNGFYYKPRMDKSTLAEHAEGLIAINGHLGSSIAHHLVQHVQTGNDDHFRAALEEARWHRDTFVPNAAGEPCFFVELQRHGVMEQERINPDLVRLARELDLPLVADNDAHFLRAEDHDAHDTLCCISMQKSKEDPARLIYSTELYVKSAAQMREQFSDLPEVIDNSARIAARCSVDLDFNDSHAPVVRIESVFPSLPTDHEAALDLVRGFGSEHALGSTEWFKSFCAEFSLEPFDQERDEFSEDTLKEQCDGALRMLAEAGAVWRYGTDGLDGEKRERLDRELKILAEKSISAYFLICWDFVNWARQNGIPAAARGSGVGTIVGYVLGLSNACPVEFGLLFERFTDPDRAEYPDIDIDICQDGRADVINYVREKYGYVAQIITFGRLKAKQALKDVARVHGLAAVDGQRLANLVPNELNITIKDALEKAPDFKTAYDTDPAIKSIVETAQALENHARHAGVHAAGVVVATEPLENIVPLCRTSGNDDVVTQWDGPTCERVGLLKMDFLGLRTLSTIELGKRLIRETLDEDAIWRAVGRTPSDGGPHPLDLDRLRMSDQKVLELFRRGDTAGIFQFESGGMRKLLLDMQPDRLRDLIAANALFRPGPMDLIPDYCQRKHGRQPVPKVHLIVDDHTAETYGIMVYQEQVMQIVHGLGDIPLREAYTLIKAISKKKHDVINAVRPKFIEGAGAKGLDERQADELFDLILKFAGYGFNKSHSTGYAIIAYHTAYLKTYFPAQYMTAVLTYESGAKKVEDWATYLETCSQTVYPDHTDAEPHVGIEVKPPDLNLSQKDFTVVFDEDEPRDNLYGHIRFGLGAIKGVGKNAIAGIIEARNEGGPFESIFDICERVSGRVVNKATVEALIKAGAFDTLHGRDARASVLAAIDDAMSAGQQAAEDRRQGQMSIFGEVQAAAPEQKPTDPPLPSITPWDEMTALAGEKETLGIHISGHPLDGFESELDVYRTHAIADIEDLPHDTPAVLGGLLTRAEVRSVRSGRNAGERMGMITIQDQRRGIDGVVFSSVFARDAIHLEDGRIVLLVVRIDQSRGAAQIIVDRVVPLEDAPRHLAGGLRLTFCEGAERVREQMQMAAGVLQQAGALRGGATEGRLVDVEIELLTDDQRVIMRAGTHRVVAEPAILQRLETVVGADGVTIIGGGVPQRSDGNDRRRWKKPAQEPVGSA